MKKQKIGKWSFWVPILILAVACVASRLIFDARTEQYKDWKEAPGVVLERKNVKDFRVRISYAYMVDGQVYRGDALYHRSSDGKAAGAGTEVTIWYDPDIPSVSSYHKPSPGMDPLVPFFFAFFFMIGWILRCAERRKNQAHSPLER